MEIKLPSIKKRQLTISRNRNNAGEMVATEKYEDEKKELRKVVYGAVDRMRVEMNDRFKRLEETDRRFGFVLDIDNLMYRQLNEANIKLSCSYLSSIYSQDLDGDDLWDEISDCRMMLKAHPKVSSPLELLKFIIQYGDESLISKSSSFTPNNADSRCVIVYTVNHLIRPPGAIQIVEEIFLLR